MLITAPLPADLDVSIEVSAFTDDGAARIDLVQNQATSSVMVR
jgi:hypothetical protein